MRQLEGIEGADTGEGASLEREAELIKTNFNREAYYEVLEQDKAGDAAMMQMLLTAQFDILSSLSDTIAMDEEAAVAHAKDNINRLLQTGYTAASQVVKPDGSLPVIEIFPPTRKGTPKRKKSAPAYLKPVAPPAFSISTQEDSTTHVSPMKSSPRRRRTAGSTKSRVSFTPLKKPKVSRGVRWRDDESEDGTLADFSRTPQKPKQSPEAPLATEQPLEEEQEEEEEVEEPVPEPAPVVSTMAIPHEPTIQEESSPSIEVPQVTAFPMGKPSRFQAGFLSKSSRMSLAQDSSPKLNAPSLSLNLGNSSSPESDGPSALQSLDVGKASNLSPPSAHLRHRRSTSSPQRSLQAIVDENSPPQPPGSGSDSESTIDARKLRSAMHSANQARRVSLLTGTAASNAKRMSSIGSLSERPTALARPSMPGSSSYSLASSTNGISRHRRGSSERRRSPPMSCSPSELRRSERALTAGQARRMNMGGSMRVDKSSSGSDSTSPKEVRRVTIGVGMGPNAGPRKPESRSSVAWR